MSANLMTIDVSSVMPAQASSANSVSETANIESGKNASANKKNSAASALRNIEAQSYNTGTDAQKALENSGFQNVLKQQLKKNESAGQTVDATALAKTKKAGADNKTDQTQSIAAFQSSVVSVVEQKQTKVDSKPGSEGKSGQVPAKTTNSSKNASESPAVLEGRQKNQGDAAQQIVTVAQKGDVKTVTMPAGEQAGDNVAALKSRSSGTASGKSSTTNTQQSSPAKSPELIKNQVHESIDSKNQLSQAQPKTQFADISAAANINNQFTQLTSTTAASDKTNNVKSTYAERVKDKTAGEKQKGNVAVSIEKNTSGQKESLSTDKLNVEKIDVVNAPKAQSGNGTQQTLTSLISTTDSAQAVTVNRTAITDHSAGTAQNGSQSSTAAEIRDQIFQSIKNSVQQGQQQISISLHPPELGRVSIKFSQQGDKVIGELQATNPQTRADIRHELPDIIRSLEESGISVKRLDVTLSEPPRQPAQESFRDNSSGDLWQQFGSQGFHDTGQNQSSPGSFVTPAYNADSVGLLTVASPVATQSAPSNSRLDFLM